MYVLLVDASDQALRRLGLDFSLGCCWFASDQASCRLGNWTFLRVVVGLPVIRRHAEWDWTFRVNVTYICARCFPESDQLVDSSVTIERLSKAWSTMPTGCAPA